MTIRTVEPESYPIDQERALFERWIQKRALFYLDWDEKADDYAKPVTRWLWECWLARAVVQYMQDVEAEDEEMQQQVDLEGNPLPGERDPNESLG